MKKIYFVVLFALQFSFAGFAQVDSLHRYSDAEVIKLTGHIKGLEERTAAYAAAHPNDVFVNNVANAEQERQILTDILADTLHRYNDAQVIKIAGYIKHLEKLDALNTQWLADIAKAKQKTADSLAAALASVTAKVNQYQNQINFDFDSSVLKKESYLALDDAVKQLQKFPEMAFAIEGHTDNVGEDAYNLNLSKARAKVVMNYFISKGIPASRLTSEGYGESKPVATNDTEEGKAKNRRVEIMAKNK